MIPKTTRDLAVAACLIVAAAQTPAAVLFEQAPNYVDGGVTSDTTTTDPSDPTTVLTQPFSVPAGATLEQIVWWGTDISGSGNAFQVLLDGVVVFDSDDTSPLLTVAVDDPVNGVKIYTLDLPDVAVGSGTLGIWNTDDATQWAWQFSLADPDVSDFDDVLAFRLEGTVLAVPEPAGVALVLAGLGVLCVVCGRSRRHSFGRAVPQQA